MRSSSTVQVSSVRAFLKVADLDEYAAGPPLAVVLAPPEAEAKTLTLTSDPTTFNGTPTSNVVDLTDEPEPGQWEIHVNENEIPESLRPPQGDGHIRLAADRVRDLFTYLEYRVS